MSEELNLTAGLVRSLRMKLGLSQEALGRELGLSWKTIARYESGAELSGSSLILLRQFCDVRGLTDSAAAFRRKYISLDSAAFGRLNCLARCSKDGEVLDDGSEFVMSGDDAVDTLESLISEARRLLGIEDPPMAQPDDRCPNCNQTREEHEDAGLAFGDDCDRVNEATEE